MSQIPRTHPEKWQSSKIANFSEKFIFKVWWRMKMLQITKKYSEYKPELFIYYWWEMSIFLIHKNVAYLWDDLINDQRGAKWSETGVIRLKQCSRKIKIPTRGTSNPFGIQEATQFAINLLIKMSSCYLNLFKYLAKIFFLEFIKI